MTSEPHNEVAWAFAHPQQRSEATADGLRDRISLRDHVVEVEIGAFQQERGTRQRVCFNVVVEVRPHDADLADDVDRILSYDKVTEAIAAELAAERLNLLETLAERVAHRILREPHAMRVFVRIEKLDRGPGALGVEIVRARQPVASRSATDPTTDLTSAVSSDVAHAPHADRSAELPAVALDRPHPQVIFLTNAAIASNHLPVWLDQIETAVRNGGHPAILCVGAADEPAPRVPHRLAQRRIDLLAIEQNAWVLAARDRRCVVVNSRTELDWAMRHGRLSVWAPSKIVLDAVDGPSTNPRNAMALVAWFAQSLQADSLTVIGAGAPDVPDLTQAAIRTDVQSLRP